MHTLFPKETNSPSDRNLFTNKIAQDEESKGNSSTIDYTNIFFSKYKVLSCFPFIELLLVPNIVLSIISFNLHKNPIESRPISSVHT